MTLHYASLILLTLYSCSIDNTVSAEPPIFSPDLAGRYCEARSLQCCSGRQDECSAPILGTLCYCDDFCNRTRNEDCCPDYWTFCKGIQVPEPIILRRCERNGNYYLDGETTKINCNLCKCQEVGGRMEMLCEDSVCLVDEDILLKYNKIQIYGWEATNYTEYWGKRYDEGLIHRLGTFHSKKQASEMSPINQIFDPGSLPRNFDARVKWKDIISKPRDQGWCGASWVFSTVAVASDRFAVMSYGNDQQFLSPQHLLSCNRNQQGCAGGYLTRAWTFIRKFGLVPDSCYPWTGGQTECAIKRFKHQVETTCPISQNRSRVELADLHRVGPAYRIAGEYGIMYEILKSGPVQALMTVSREFFSYNRGIYRCSKRFASDRIAHHSVRIVGWGEENQNNQLVKYWIVSNSWGEWWGENGYFRIQRGTNECHIEEFVISAWANIENINTMYQTRIEAQVRGDELMNQLR